MPFVRKNFSPIGGQARGGNSPCHWSYRSDTDDLATVQAANYFDEVGTQLFPKDFINVALTDGNAILTVASTTIKPPGIVIDSAVIGSGAGGGTGAFSIVFKPDEPLNLVVSDNLTWMVLDSASAQTIMIPHFSTEEFPIGAEMAFTRFNPATVTFLGEIGVTIDSRDGLVMLNARYSGATLKHVFQDEWLLIGDLA